MTCVSAVKGDSRIYFAADSLTSNGQTFDMEESPKLFRASNLIIGVTTSWRWAQILRFHVEAGCPDIDCYKWLVREYVPAVQAAMIEHGFGSHAERGDYEGGQCVVGCPDGTLAVIEGDYQVSLPGKVVAIGSGHEVARGSMAASLRLGVSAKRAVADSIRDAASYVVSVGGPVKTMSRALP